MNNMQIQVKEGSTEWLVDTCPPTGFRKKDDVDGLTLGFARVSKRGLFRNKTLHRPLILSKDKILQHITVTARTGSGVSQWLMEKAGEVMGLGGWVVWYLDFLHNNDLELWNRVARPHVLQENPMDNKDLLEMAKADSLTDAYVYANEATIPTVYRFVKERLLQKPENDVWMILNNLPQANHEYFLKRMVEQCRAARVGLLFRFQDQQKSDFRALVDENVRTKISFPPDHRI